MQKFLDNFEVYVGVLTISLLSSVTVIYAIYDHFSSQQAYFKFKENECAKTIVIKLYKDN